MSRKSEVAKLLDECEAKGYSLTAQYIVDRTEDNEKEFPNLHGHLWNASEIDLLKEARLARAYRVIISIIITPANFPSEVTTRLLVHTTGAPGYVSHQTVVSSLDLAKLKLAEFKDDIRRASERFSKFRMLLNPKMAAKIEKALAALDKSFNTAKANEKRRKRPDPEGPRPSA